jgi:hypothetical protein
MNSGSAPYSGTTHDVPFRETAAATGRLRKNGPRQSIKPRIPNFILPRSNVADLTLFAPGEYPVFETYANPLALAKQFSYSGRDQLWGSRR